MYTTLEEYRSWIALYNAAHYNFFVDDLCIKDNKIYTVDTCIKINEQICLIDNKLPVRFGNVKNFHVENIHIFDTCGLPQNTNGFCIEDCNTLPDVDLSHMKCSKICEFLGNPNLENIVLPSYDESFFGNHECYDVLFVYNKKLKSIDFKNISSNTSVDILMKYNANTEIFKMFKNTKRIKKLYAMDQTLSNLNGIGDFIFDTLKINITYLQNFNHIEKTKTRILSLYYPNIFNMCGFVNILKAFIVSIKKPDGIPYYIDSTQSYNIYYICDKYINNIQQSSRIDYSMDMVLEFLDSHQIDIS